MAENREIWSFFTGAMGLDLGLERAGLIPTLATEIDPSFCSTIRKNRPELTLIQGDVTTATAEKLRKMRGFSDDVYLMVGGPPCQSFSSGGKRHSLADPRGNLVFEYLRLVSEVRPLNFVFENVANFATAALEHRPIADRPGQHWSLKRYDTEWQHGEGDKPALTENELSGSAIRSVLEAVRALNYHVTFGILDAADYGAAQHRLRFIMIGSREGPAPALPELQYGPPGSGLLPFVTVKDAIWHLKDSPGQGSQYTDRVKQYFSLVPAGGNWRSLPETLKEEALGGAFASGGGKTGFYRRLDWDKPSPTITGRPNRKGTALCHPSDLRPVSVAECAALQGFPPDWQFIGSMNMQYLQIGNAVPVPLGFAVGRALQTQISRPVLQNALDFETMLEAAVKRLRASARNKRPVAATLF